LCIDEPINYRLPKNLSPYLYDLRLKPYIGPQEVYKNKSFTFEGTQIIHFTCMEPTKQIVFNSLDLNLNAGSLSLVSETDRNGIKVAKSIKYDLVRQFAIVEMNQECKKNSNYTLRVEYTGVILEVLYGFYRSSYKDTDGNVK
jgi:hypothetical protein